MQFALLPHRLPDEPVSGRLLQTGEQIGADPRLVPIVEQASEKQGKQVNLVKITDDIVFVGVDRDRPAFGKCLLQNVEGAFVLFAI
jgi:hypothetical protein